MNATLITTFWRQRLNSPMRLMLALVFFGFGLLPVMLTGSIAMLGKNTMGVFAFVFAAGLIGQDVSSGVLTLAFARPLRRWEYVLSRWLAAGSLATAVCVLQVVAGAAVSLARHGDVTAALMAAKMLDGALVVFGLSAVLLMFSSLAPGLGDLGLYLLAFLAASVMTNVGAAKRIGWLTRAGEECQRFIDGSLDPAPFFGHGEVSWFAIASYLSTLAICLVVAIWAVNRKELSYAAG